jgi:hypothetical protein
MPPIHKIILWVWCAQQTSYLSLLQGTIPQAGSTWWGRGGRTGSKRPWRSYSYWVTVFLCYFFQLPSGNQGTSIYLLLGVKPVTTSICWHPWIFYVPTGCCLVCLVLKCLWMLYYYVESGKRQTAVCVKWWWSWHQVCSVCGSLLLLPAEEKSDPGRCSLLWINILQVVYFEEMTSRQNQKRGGREGDREKEKAQVGVENLSWHPLTVLPIRSEGNKPRHGKLTLMT